jgi:transcription initiation factor TFIID subunit TAF12
VARTAVIAGTATATSNAINKRGAQKQAAQQQAAASQQQADAQQQQMAAQLQAQQDELERLKAQQAAPDAPADAPAAAGDGTDVVAQLTKLADLKAAGVLSDAEFDAAKAKLLS